MENLLAMPASPMEIMLGKVLPYLVVGAVQVSVVLVAAKLLFGIPFVGPMPAAAGPAS
jgi:ABC-2 type transport system permease protein